MLLYKFVFRNNPHLPSTELNIFAKMIALSHKAKQYLSITAKLLVFCATFGYIYYKFLNIDPTTLSNFKLVLSFKNDFIYFLIIALLIATLNWLLEIKKWQLLATIVTPTSFRAATKQSLAALTVSLLTPNRIGDYGAKALFFKKPLRKQILLLNFFGNNMQLIQTIIFGMLGLGVLVYKYAVAFSKLHLIIFISSVLIFVGLGYFLREKKLFIKGLSIKNILIYYKHLSFTIKWFVFILSVLRYFIFSTLFFGLLGFFNAHISYFEALPYIFSMYLLSSILPTLFILDVAVRGSVAVWLFSFIGVAEITVVCVVLCMWVLNFVIPSIIGSFFVLRIKSEKL